MGVMDRLKFWKKDDSFGAPLNKDAFADLGKDSLQENFEIGGDADQGPFGRQPEQHPLDDPVSASQILRRGTVQEQPQMSGGYGSRQDLISKDIEVVSAKLDALRSTLDSMNQRIANIERIAEKEQSRPRY